MLGEILFKSEESIQGLHIKPMTLINKVKELKYRFFHSDISLPHGASYVKPSRNVGLVIMTNKQLPGCKDGES